MKNQKTPKQIASELKHAAEVIAATLQAKKEAAGELHFVYHDEVYVPVLKKVIIPGQGEMTALDICSDQEVQAQLVKNESGIIKKFEPKPTA